MQTHPLRGFLAAVYHHLLDWYVISLRKELNGCDSVLDLGCGEDSPLRHCRRRYSVGVDSFLPYLGSGRGGGIHSKYFQGDIRHVNFAKGSFDAVIALDVLEHLSKDEGNDLLERMEFWARRKVIIFTCQGFVPQEPYDGNPHQEHRSGWQGEEFAARGYRVRGMRGWAALRTERADLRFSPGLVWFPISEATQLLTYWRPSLAFQLFCVKDVTVSSGTASLEALATSLRPSS